MKPLNSENAAPGADFGVTVPMPGVPGDAALPEGTRVPLRELMDDRLLDALLERSRDQAGGLRLTGEGSMLGELVKAVLERALEAELLAADYFPQVFHGAIVYSPSSFASPAQNDSGQPAWTLDGKGIVNVPIPEDDISGPVLALDGGDDALVTDAGQSANEIAFDLASEGGDRYQGQAFVYPDAGHAVGTFPYQPITTAAIDTLGGTRAGDLAAQQAGWSKVLGLLAQLSR
jgi:hypothetical protein